jgi:hypothetical protein
LFAALQKQPRHLFNKQRHAAGPFVDSLDHLLGERVTGGNLADHARDARAIQRGERNQTVV